MLQEFLLSFDAKYIEVVPFYRGVFEDFIVKLLHEAFLR